MLPPEHWRDASGTQRHKQGFGNKIWAMATGKQYPQLPQRLSPYVSRRDFLARVGGGFGGLALSCMLAQEANAAAFKPNVTIDPVQPLRVRAAHFPARARNVIFLFMYGGPSQVDTFDYKPLLSKLDGKPVPESIKQLGLKDKVQGVFNSSKDQLYAGPFKWRQHGQCGRWVSELYPRVGEHVDDLCLIHSLHCDSSNHAPATFQMNTGDVLNGKPSMGSWVTYGLGTENENLPGFVLLFEVGGFGGAANWGSAFLPAAFQGTRFRDQGVPVLDLKPPEELARVQRSTLDVIKSLNLKHLASRPGLLDLDARIASYELAYRMQTEASDVGDLSRETPETLEMYGVNDPDRQNAKYARKCLTARRLVEKGVRFVQVYNGFDELGWDAHNDLEKNHRVFSRQTDRPIAALLTDLKQRGLLDQTLVIWAGEFGRTPMMQGDNGRNHNPYGYTAWLAGGGVKGGQAIGATDEIGLRAVEDPHSLKDFHATVLAALGLKNDELFFEHNGRPERLTGVAGTGKPIKAVFG
jgi:hypothetical protein